MPLSCRNIKCGNTFWFWWASSVTFRSKHVNISDILWGRWRHWLVLWNTWLQGQRFWVHSYVHVVLGWYAFNKRKIHYLKCCLKLHWGACRTYFSLFYLTPENYSSQFLSTWPPPLLGYICHWFLSWWKGCRDHCCPASQTLFPAQDI